VGNGPGARLGIGSTRSHRAATGSETLVRPPRLPAALLTTLTLLSATTAALHTEAAAEPAPAARPVPAAAEPDAAEPLTPAEPPAAHSSAGQHGALLPGMTEEEMLAM
jgi:hypothetical protein